MWILERNLYIRKISAIYDKEKKKVVTYYYIDDESEQDENILWYDPAKNESFYETEQAALKAKEERQKELRSKFEEVKNFVDLMDEIESTDDFKFEKTDYLPEYVAEPWERTAYEEYKNKYYFLKRLFIYGMMNINGDSFRKDDIVRIEWAEKETIKQGKKETKHVAVLVLKDGKRVETFSDEEYDIITDVFGGNWSKQVYTLRNQ